MSMIGLETALAAFGISIEQLKAAASQPPNPADPEAIAALEPVTVDDAVEPEDAVALANANKAAINAIIAALQGTPEPEPEPPSEG